MDYMELNFDLNGDGVLDSQAFEIDSNEDGVMDTVAVDTDGDGYYETLGNDIDGDGYIDEYQADTDGDGYLDTTITADNVDDFLDPVDNTDSMDDIDNTDSVGAEDLLLDTDGDGKDDQLWEDTDSDGTYDKLTTADDTDGDGVRDTLHEHIFVDVDGDGEFDYEDIYKIDSETDAREYVKSYKFDVDDEVKDDEIIEEPNKDDLVQIEPIVVDGVDNGIMIDELENFDPATADMDKVVGNPAAAMEIWECQGNTGRCSLYAQMFAIEELTGQDIDIEEFADIAEANGWFSEDGGTPANYCNKMAEYYGLETEVTYENSLSDIAEALNNGEKVLIGIDADEIWHGENDDIYAPDGSNHAVEVIGIDYSDPENPMIILNDSGHEDGCGSMVPYQTFMDAWDDSGCRMTRCWVD